MLSDSSSNLLHDYHLALQVFGSGLGFNSAIGFSASWLQVFGAGKYISSVQSRIWHVVVFPGMCTLCFLANLGFFEPLREACHWLLPQSVFDGMASSHQKPAEVAVVWLWTSLHRGDKTSCSPHGLCTPIFSWLLNWVLVEDFPPESSRCFSLFSLCCCFIFLKTWFSWILLGCNPRFVAQLHLRKSHTHWNWEKTDSESPRKST